MECFSFYYFFFSCSPTSAFAFFGPDEYWNSLIEDESFWISAYKGCLSLIAMRNWERTILVTARLGNLAMSTKFRH